jgi:hypothetical protein
VIADRMEIRMKSDLLAVGRPTRRWDFLRVLQLRLGSFPSAWHPLGRIAQRVPPALVFNRLSLGNRNGINPKPSFQR